MIKLRCLRATQHEQNLQIRFYCYVHILLQKFYMDFEKCIIHLFMHAVFNLLICNSFSYHKGPNMS